MNVAPTYNYRKHPTVSDGERQRYGCFCSAWIVCQTSPIQLLSYTQRDEYRIVAKIELNLWQLHFPHIGNLFLSCLEFAPLRKKKSWFSPG